MTEMLRDAIARVETLPVAKQEQIATILLTLVDRAWDETWDETLSSPESLRALERMAEEARDDLRAGRVEAME